MHYCLLSTEAAPARACSGTVLVRGQHLFGAQRPAFIWMTERYVAAGGSQGDVPGWAECMGRCGRGSGAGVGGLAQLNSTKSRALL